MRQSGRIEPIILAVVVTVLNGFKPAAIDDSAYLLMGKHLTANPLDPYGFEMFWYYQPDPAMHVLLPPVLPYWLSLCFRVAGDHLFWVKFGLLPFALLLAFSLRFLLRRFAPEYERPMLVMQMLSGAVLCTFGVMLDIPALSLGLAAAACFIRGCDTARIRWVILAGVLTGFAMQTKYSMLTIPVVMLGYGLLSRRILWGILATLIPVAMFAAWEYLLFTKYGESHFLYHLDDQPPFSLSGKFLLFQPMLGQLGGISLAVAMVAGFAAGLNRWVVATGTVWAFLGVGIVCSLPASEAWIVTGKLDWSKAVFVSIGSACGLAVIACAGRMLVSNRDRDTVFIVGWLVLEFVAYFALTPFPAARRLISLVIVGGLVAARMLSLRLQANPEPRVPRWFVPVGIAAGLGLFAFDVCDAHPEKVLAERAATIIGEPGPHTVWFNGHWGFQYYCDRAGMKPVVPRQSVLRTGDWLVFPVIPDDWGFYRPYHGQAKFLPDPECLELIDELEWEDRVPAQMIPNFYGGGVPITGRDHPRLHLAIYRVTQDWTPEYVE